MWDEIQLVRQRRLRCDARFCCGGTRGLARPVGRRDFDVTLYTLSKDVIHENRTTIFEENPEVEEKVAELRGLEEK